MAAARDRYAEVLRALPVPLALVAAWAAAAGCPGPMSTLFVVPAPGAFLAPAPTSGGLASSSRAGFPAGSTAPTGTAATAAAAAAAVALVLGAVARAGGWRPSRSRVLRRARGKSFGGTLHSEVPQNILDLFRDPDAIRVRYGVNYIPGTRGYNNDTVPWRPPPPPARMSLSKVVEAAAEFRPGDFNLAPFAGLSKSDVKQTGSYTIAPGSDRTIQTPGKFPTYVKPHPERLEKEPGMKRPPRENEAYQRYVDRRASLVQAATACSQPMDKDFVADRGVFMLLLSWLDDVLGLELTVQGQKNNPVDLVKISRAPVGKAIVLERLFEKKNLMAEFRPYRGAWKRSEVSNKGNYMPALQRLATGDSHTKSMMVTGLWQIAGRSAGAPVVGFRFVEWALGGLKFLVRAPSQFVTEDGKNVEMAHKNFYYRQKVKILDTYYKLLLGGTDMISLGIHRSGKLLSVAELTIDGLVEQLPEVVQSAERRMGRLVALLEKVKSAVESSTDPGPWVLQWQRGVVVLGKYEPPEEEVAPPPPSDLKAKEIQQAVDGEMLFSA